MYKIAWGITGAGHYLEETINLMEKLCQKYEMDVYLSKASEEVLVKYGLYHRMNSMNVYRDRTASSHWVGKFYGQEYEALVVAPATSNTVAKCVTGIADNLVTNIFAHAGKNRIPTVVLPCDADSEIFSKAPEGIVRVQTRKIDLDNTRKLEIMESVQVVFTPEALAQWFNLQ